MEQQVIEKGLSLVDQIVQGLKDTAPQMADLTLAAMKLSAVIDLGQALLTLVITVALLVFSYHQIQKPGTFEGGETPDVFIAVFTGIPGIFLGIITLCNLADKYMWAALVDPKLALAMRALDKVLTVTNTK